MARYTLATGRAHLERASCAQRPGPASGPGLLGAASAPARLAGLGAGGRRRAGRHLPRPGAARRGPGGGGPAWAISSFGASASLLHAGPARPGRARGAPTGLAAWARSSISPPSPSSSCPGRRGPRRRGASSGRPLWERAGSPPLPATLDWLLARRLRRLFRRGRRRQREPHPLAARQGLRHGGHRWRRADAGRRIGPSCCRARGRGSSPPRRISPSGASGGATCGLHLGILWVLGPLDRDGAARAAHRRTLVPRGRQHAGQRGRASGFARGLGRGTGDLWLWFPTLIAGFWIFFSTQRGVAEGFARSVTEILWTGSDRARSWAGERAPRLLPRCSRSSCWRGRSRSRLGDPLASSSSARTWARWTSSVLSVHTLWVNRALLPRGAPARRSGGRAWWSRAGSSSPGWCPRGWRARSTCSPCRGG